MKRREFLSLVGGAAAAWPIVARAQQPAMPMIGFLGAATAGAYEPRLQSFHQALKNEGFVEGQNVKIEYRWSGEQYEKLPALAAELVRMQVSVIIAAGGAQTALAAKAATTRIPIVFQNGSDPVKIGLVKSLARPGGNLTGVTNITVETVLKRLELMRELVPRAEVLAYMINPRNPNSENIVKDIGSASRMLGRQIVIVNFASRDDMDEAFASLVRQRVGGLVLSADPIVSIWRDGLLERVARHAIPAIFPYRDFAEAGGLASYGANLSDVYRQVGVYAGRILKGESASELPVVQSTKFELVVNNKTAKALGLEVPLSLLMRIDSVID